MSKQILLSIITVQLKQKNTWCHTHAHTHARTQARAHTHTNTHTHTLSYILERIQKSQTYHIWNNLQWNIRSVFWFSKLLSTRVSDGMQQTGFRFGDSLSNTCFSVGCGMTTLNISHIHAGAADNSRRFRHINFFIVKSSEQITRVRGQLPSQPYQRRRRKWATPNVRGELKIAHASSSRESGSSGTVGLWIDLTGQAPTS